MELRRHTAETTFVLDDECDGLATATGSGATLNLDSLFLVGVIKVILVNQLSTANATGLCPYVYSRKESECRITGAVSGPHHALPTTALHLSVGDSTVRVVLT